MSAPSEVGAVNIVLIGSMGSGKSSVAREIAKRTSRRWVDTDRVVIERTGLSIAEIFKLHGEDHFRELETDALQALPVDAGLIVATGGGIVVREENRGWLQRLGCVVWLHAREEVLFERVSRNRRRPLLRTENPRDTLRELLARRRPFYEACAHWSVDTSDESHALIAEKILAGTCDFLPRRESLSPP